MMMMNMHHITRPLHTLQNTIFTHELACTLQVLNILHCTQHIDVFVHLFCYARFYCCRVVLYVSVSVCQPVAVLHTQCSSYIPAVYHIHVRVVQA